MQSSASDSQDDGYESPLAPLKPPTLAAPFTNFDQQANAVDHGARWAVAGILVLFAAMIAVYWVGRIGHYDDFVAGARVIAKFGGIGNTALVLASAFLVSMSVQTARLDDRKNTIILLIIAITFALGSLNVIVWQDSELFHKSLLFASHAAVGAPATPLFFGLYFILTGMFSLLLLTATCLAAWAIARSFAGDFSARDHAPLAAVSLVFQATAIVWVMMFPLFYGVG